MDRARPRCLYKHKGLSIVLIARPVALQGSGRARLRHDAEQRGSPPAYSYALPFFGYRYMIMYFFKLQLTGSFESL